MNPLTASLWITLIGMGLVFVAILILWGLMEALMALTARSAAAEAAAEAEGEEEPGEEPPAAAPDLSGLKKRAAAAAVAAALSLRRPSLGAGRAAQAHAGASAWQAVTRASQLNQPTHITRKP